MVFSHDKESLMAVKKKASTGKKAATTRKKAAAKSTGAAKKTKVSSPYNKSALYNHLAQNTGLSRKQVASVFDELKSAIHGHVAKDGPKLFTLPGLLKVKVVHKPATKSRKGINPFTGEETVFKAKPARNVVKIQALKALKQMAT
jgi:nucleoid DNA-binding protein